MVYFSLKFLKLRSYFYNTSYKLTIQWVTIVFSLLKYWSIFHKCHKKKLSLQNGCIRMLKKPSYYTHILEGLEEH